MKMSLDEREFLHDLVNSNGWPVLLRMIDDKAQTIDRRVLTFNLTDGAAKLVHEKARSEGARLLQRAIISIKDDFKKADRGL